MKLNLNKPTQKSTASDAPAKSEFWLNVGYVVSVETDNGAEDSFVSLPFGIPLDNLKPYEINSSSDTFAFLRMAQNNLIEAVLEAAYELDPGESRVISAGDQLAVELRRIKDARTDLKKSDNPFLRKLSF